MRHGSSEASFQGSVTTVHHPKPIDANANLLTPSNGGTLTQPNQLHLRGCCRLPVRLSRFAIGNQRSHPRLVRLGFGPFNIAIVVLAHSREMSARHVEVKLHRFQMSLSRRFDGTVSLYRPSHLVDDLVHPPFVRKIDDQLANLPLKAGTFSSWI